MNSIILYNYYRSSTSYRVRIALHHKNLPFEYKPVHLLNNGGEQFSEDYLRLNPQAEVPTLIHNGKVIGQSMAIIEYLDEVFPETPLFAKDPYQKAVTRQFCENINSFMHPICNLKVLKKLETDCGYNQEQKEAWIQHWAGIGFQTLEKITSQTSGKYCFHDQLSAADLFLAPMMFSANRFKVDLTKYKNLNKIHHNLENLESFQKAHPARQPDTPPAERSPAGLKT